MSYSNLVSNSFVQSTTASGNLTANYSNVAPSTDYLSSGSSISVANSFTGSTAIDWNSVTPTFDPSLGDRLSTPLSLSGADALGTTSSDTTWTFICTPEEISWTTSNAANRVDIFGTNNPPAISGTKGMREFSLNNALVEGFTRNKKVEAKVLALEDLLKFKSSLAGGYVNVPVYQVWANRKGYGQQAYFLIKSVQVKEMMRDLAGDATRAYVDVSFLEVPAFQVDSGIDQAPFSQQGSNTSLTKVSAANAEANKVAVTAQQNAKAKTPPSPATPKR